MNDEAVPPQATIRPALPTDAPALGALALRARAHWGYDAAFIAAGWRLAALVDVPAPPRDDLPLPPGSRFPFFTVLAFDKPQQQAS